MESYYIKLKLNIIKINIFLIQTIHSNNIIIIRCTLPKWTKRLSKPSNSVHGLAIPKNVSESVYVFMSFKIRFISINTRAGILNKLMLIYIKYLTLLSLY